MDITSPDPLHLDNIRALKVLGKGAMGTVFLAYDSLSDPTSIHPFALKIVDKFSNQDAISRARWEIGVLSSLRHPFLPRLLGSFEEYTLMGWALPFCPGGDLNVLRYHQNDRVFSEGVIRFYLAEIVCALEHLHCMGIAYRDLKPENVLIQLSGHVTLTDFDLSKRLSRDSDPTRPRPVKRSCRKRGNLARVFATGSGIVLTRAKSARVSPVGRRKMSFPGDLRSYSFVGTEEYVSPEVVRGDGHAFAVDWWALGILAYEMLFGKTPFRGTNRTETFRNVLAKKPEFTGKRTALMDLIERLLEKEPTKRLGYHGGAEEVKSHVFFTGLRWDLLTEVLRPPFVPSNEMVESLTEKVTALGYNVRDYFDKLRAPPSFPNSPLRSLSSEYQRNVSLTEF